MQTEIVSHKACLKYELSLSCGDMMYWIWMILSTSYLRTTLIIHMWREIIYGTRYIVNKTMVQTLIYTTLLYVDFVINSSGVV